MMRVPAVMRAAVVAVAIATAGGCSTMGRVADALTFWDNGNPTANLENGKRANPERVADALQVTREKMRLAPREPYWTFRMGELYAAVDSTAQAFSHLQAALVLDPGYAPAAALLSKLYYEVGMFEPAVTLLDNFITHNSNAPDALRAALALHLEALGDLDRANAVLDQCSSTSKDARATRTFVSLRGDDFQSVMETAKQVLDDNPNSAANHNNYGITLLHAGRPYEARKAFQDALALNDKLPGALYNMAIVETFYFFDEDAGRQWFARYRQYSSDDPDDLASTLGNDLSKATSADRKP